MVLINGTDCRIHPSFMFQLLFVHRPASAKPHRSLSQCQHLHMETVAQFCYIQEFFGDDCTDSKRVERVSSAMHSDTGAMFNSQSWMQDHTLVEILSRETTTQHS